MGIHNKLDQSQIDQIISLRAMGKTNRAIGEITGINWRTVKHHSAGMYKPPEPFTDGEILDIKIMREEGNILQTIATKYKCSIWRIKAALKTEPSQADGVKILNYSTYGDPFIFQPKIT